MALTQEEQYAAAKVKLDLGEMVQSDPAARLEALQQLLQSKLARGGLLTPEEQSAASEDGWATAVSKRKKKGSDAKWAAHWI